MYNRNRLQGTVIVCSALILLIATLIPAAAQKVSLPRASSPLLLLGFESPDSAAVWTGMQASVTTANASEGKSALTVTYPKWDGKGAQYLPATVAWNGGKGYSVKDWSHYGKFAFDAWVDGDKPLEVTVELRGDPGTEGWTKELLFKPGVKNAFELSLADASDTINVGNVESITFHGVRPAADIRATIDNVRLLPGDKLPLASFDLVYPNYREMIFPGVPTIKVNADVQVQEYGLDPAGLALLLTATAGKVTRSGRSAISGNPTSMTVPAADLPVGPVAVTATLTDTRSGKVLGSAKWSLRRISAAERGSLKVYVDERNNTVVDGKPFFPIGWFGNSSFDQLAEIADSPYNTMLAYGVNGKSKAYMMKYLDSLQENGMKLIYCMNDIYPTATYYDETGWEGIFGNDNIADAVVNTFKSHPAVLAWYLNDERPKELVPRFVNYYKQAQRNDPNHPCFIVIYHLPEMKYFSETTDIMGVDRYPVPMDPVTVVADEMAIAKAAVKGHKPVYAVIQAFGWYQYDEAYDNDRGRIPNEQDLRAGRAPSVDEVRCMTYLALAHGAKGIIDYCYYDFRVLPQYAEMWAGLKKIAGEVKALSPVLLSADDLGEAALTEPNPAIHTSVRVLDGQTFLIAVNSANAPSTVTFDLKKAPTGRSMVMFEGRFMRNWDGAKLTDSFKPFEAHVYDLGRLK